MILGQKVKAGALQLTLFVVVVVALLLSSFVLLVHTHNRFRLQTDFLVETIEDANNGMNYSLHNKIPLQDTLYLPNNNVSYKSTTLYRDKWGLFDKVISTSKTKKKVFKKIALFGVSQSKNDRTALVINENNMPLVMVGKSKIEGVAYLPERGVKSGNISGESYYRKYFVYGKTKRTKNIPSITNEKLKHIKSIATREHRLEASQFLNLKMDAVYQNSFFQPVKVIQSNNAISLSQTTITGHIVIRSSTKISVDSSAYLTDCILIAPIIEIRNHVRGNFQAFATKKILVGQNCTLNYPSAIVLIEDETNENRNDRSKIVIETGSEVEGVVLFLGKEKQKNYDSQIVIKKNALVKGEVYCNQNIEHSGKVAGSIFTDEFIVKEGGSVYINHLYNGTISINSLPQEYVGLPLEQGEKGILKWLY